MTLKELFFEVADLPDEAAQRARLAELGASDEQIEQVLDLCRRERDRLPTTPTRFSLPVQAAAARLAGNELQSGDRLGPWLLKQPLGEGGMGRVFLAERADGLYQQRVAVKLLRGAAPPELLARERQILATLEHPHIARLLDGGATPRGRPYLVMAFVEGQTLDRWAATASLARKLALIEQIAGALDHAHRHLVVHCDLKPANVMVSAEGHAVLLDFGIAQLERETQGGAIQGLTPHYASPEQLRGEPLSSATDIFGLGKLIEPLLAGAPREREWRAIVSRACAAEPSQRYPSALALVDDLRRWQQHRPVQALPRTPGYVAARLLRRQWPAWLAGAAALAMAGGFTWQLVQARERAEREARVAAQTADYLVGLFKGASPLESGRPDLPVRELVDRGRDRLGDELKDQPALQGRLQGVLSRVYRSMGSPREALPLAQAAVAAAQAGDDRLAEADAWAELARAQANVRSLEEAVVSARRALALREAHAGPKGWEAGQSHHQLLVLLSDTREFDAAEQHGRWAAEALAREPDRDPEQSITLQANQGRMHLFAGHPAQAEPFLRQALALRTRHSGAEHASTLTTAANLAAVLHDLQRLGEAEAMLRQLLQQRSRLHGAKSQQVMETVRELGLVLLDAGRYDEALATMREALDLVTQVAGPQSSGVAGTQRYLGDIHAARGELPQAEAAYREALTLGEGKALSARTQARARQAWARL
ncbi:MAG: serine/threonine protein kinase, partial [Burkholderiales bacterium]|nr:serine/threonine protein kinase [Burkholderiales bacterium]